MKEHDILFLVGADGSHLGSSIYLREIEGREDGAAPHVDLEAEKRHGDFVRGLIRGRLALGCHDLSDGGLAVALAEMCMASGLGMQVKVGEGYGHALLFGEDQARYVIAIDPAHAGTVVRSAEAAGVPLRELGVAQGDRLGIAPYVDVSVADLTVAHESWFPDFMSGTVVEPAAAA